MSEFVYLTATTTNLLLSVVQTAILVHVIMSWFDPEGSSLISRFTYYIAEPFVIPVRAVLKPLQEHYGSPLDFSYVITSMILVIIETLLV